MKQVFDHEEEIMIQIVTIQFLTIKPEEFLKLSMESEAVTFTRKQRVKVLISFKVRNYEAFILFTSKRTEKISNENIFFYLN